MKRQEVLSFLHEMSRSEPQNFANWLRLGNLYVELAKASGQTTYLDAAEQSYEVGIALRPASHWAYFNRGLMYLERKDYPRARSDFDRVIEHRPNLVEAYINRALARLGARDFQGAIDDLTHALEFKDAPTRAYFLRARARAGLGDRAGAARDRAAGLERTPRDAVSWVVRGLAKLPADPQGALADFDSALAVNPIYDLALENKAALLSERLGRTQDAIDVLNTAVKAHPGYVTARAGRGVLFARLGRRDDALADAREVLERDDKALTTYQAACVYALTSRKHPADRAEALRLVAEAVRKDGSWLEVARKDPDLLSLRDHPEFGKLLEALEVVVGSKTY
jgi:tetratricopeptide (TPR) repeat protein